MQTRIRVTLQTAALPAAGEGRRGTLDRDVVADDLGLPYLPARRVKGLLLEAAWEVASSLRREPGWSPEHVRAWIDLDRVFGRPGQGIDGVGLWLDNLTLAERTDLLPWLRWASASYSTLFGREAVLATFTEQRSQTAIDPVTGAPLRETLRRSRVLRRGLSFVVTATLSGVRPDANALADARVRTLALACSALKRLGLARNHGGIGWVETRLDLPDGAGGWTDVTDDIVHQLAEALAEPVAPVTPASEGAPLPAMLVVDVPAAVTPPFDPATAFVLPLPFELERPALVALAAGSPSLQRTLSYVPGSALLGALAWRWIELNGLTAPLADPAFRRLFVDGGVRFLDAHPELTDQDRRRRRRLLPVPLSLRQIKGTSMVRDLAAPPRNGAPAVDGSLDEDEPLVGLHRDAVDFVPGHGSFTVASVRRQVDYHTARASNRALGRAIEPDGELFTYEAISAGQRFVGAALGSEADLQALADLLAREPAPLMVGRSGSAEYGGGLRFDQPLRPVQFRTETRISAPERAPAPERASARGTPPTEAAPTIVSRTDAEASDSAIDADDQEDDEYGSTFDVFGEDDEYGADEYDEDDDNVGVSGDRVPTLAKLVVTLTSPLLAADEHGAPTLEFPVAELDALLRSSDVGWLLDDEEFTLVDCYQASESVGGFSGVWRLPKPQWDAISAGSVFVFSGGILPDPDTLSAKLAAVEWHSFGLRTAEGFGRFTVDVYSDARQRDLSLADLHPPEPEEPRSTVPGAMARIVDEVTSAARLALVRRRAAALAEALPTPETGGLASRLSHLAHLARDRAGFAEVARMQNWGTLRPREREHLEERQRRLADGRLALGELEEAVLRVTFDNTGRLTTLPIVPADANDLSTRRERFGLPPLPVDDVLLRERQVFLLRLASELRRRSGV